MKADSTPNSTPVEMGQRGRSRYIAETAAALPSARPANPRQSRESAKSSTLKLVKFFKFRASMIAPFRSKRPPPNFGP